MRPYVLAVAAEVGDGRTGAQLLLDADRSCVLPAVIGSESALGGVGWAGPGVRLPPRRLSLLIPSAVRSCPYNHATLALTPGTRLGVYEVTAQIGEGGHGRRCIGRPTPS